ncbi:MAG: nicotinate-nucleotide adenylyltransferase [Gammaproteobacteria bacterium]|nr:nicotinate-nucleotide adenylyltransferase [Gammaproteobacteria bacterium]MBU1647661.1 nicotinate-nucleotide adenylyltransferase [Gammaproteobacteria bacterium]MBU1971807.1 nicotinate-nucleotide adenylyltransferase [Gammaproteobacteria bacterium]
MTEAAIGILGGTFDPVHSAHLALAKTARRMLGLERILWIPAGQPRHRDTPLAPGTDRLAMVELAIAGHSAFEIDASEVLSETPSYTVPTLERLRTRFGTARPLLLLLGADAFLGLPTWHRWRELFGLAHLAVATRPGFALDTAAMAAELAAEFDSRHHDTITGPAGTITTFSLVAGTVSATETRAMLAAGQDPGDWLPPGILDYIRTHHLYGT